MLPQHLSMMICGTDGFSFIKITQFNSSPCPEESGPRDCLEDRKIDRMSRCYRCIASGSICSSCAAYIQAQSYIARSDLNRECFGFPAQQADYQLYPPLHGDLSLRPPLQGDTRTHLPRPRFPPRSFFEVAKRRAAFDHLHGMNMNSESYYQNGQVAHRVGIEFQGYPHASRNIGRGLLHDGMGQDARACPDCNCHFVSGDAYRLHVASKLVGGSMLEHLGCLQRRQEAGFESRKVLYTDERRFT